MELKIKNDYLDDVASFLTNNLELGGIKNVERMRVVKQIKEAKEQLSEDEMELLKEYAELDEDGNPMQFEDGTFKVDRENVPAFKEQQKSLYEQEITFDNVNLQSALETVSEAVLNHNGDLKGEAAFSHYYLYEQFYKEDPEEAEAD